MTAKREDGSNEKSKKPAGCLSTALSLIFLLLMFGICGNVFQSSPTTSKETIPSSTGENVETNTIKSPEAPFASGVVLPTPTRAPINDSVPLISTKLTPSSSTIAQSDTIESIFNDPQSVCNAMFAFGLPPMRSKTGQVWTSDGYEWGCITGNYVLSKGSYNAIGDVDNTMTYFVTSESANKVDRIRLRGEFFNVSEAGPAMMQYEKAITFLFDSLGLTLPSSLHNKLWNTENAQFEFPHGTMELSFDNYNMGTGATLEIIVGETNAIPPSPSNMYLDIEIESFVGKIMDTANVRSGPSTEASILDVLEPATVVTIVATNQDSTWYKLDNGSWVASFLVQKE